MDMGCLECILRSKDIGMHYLPKPRAAQHFYDLLLEGKTAMKVEINAKIIQNPNTRPSKPC